MQLDAMGGREGHVGQDVGLGLVTEAGELVQLGPQQVGHPSPLSPEVLI